MWHFLTDHFNLRIYNNNNNNIAIQQVWFVSQFTHTHNKQLSFMASSCAVCGQTYTASALHTHVQPEKLLHLSYNKDTTLKTFDQLTQWRGRYQPALQRPAVATSQHPQLTASCACWQVMSPRCGSRHDEFAARPATCCSRQAPVPANSQLTSTPPQCCLPIPYRIYATQQTH